jgi:TonB family protein
MKDRKQTANERFKAHSRRRGLWVAIAAAILVHAGVLLFAPPMQVDPASVAGEPDALLVLVGGLRPPLEPWQDTALEVVPVNALGSPPQLVNLRPLQNALRRVYPPDLWRYREEGGARFQVWIDAAGEVRRASLIESYNPATDEAMLHLAQHLRFEPPRAGERAVAVVGQVEIVVEIDPTVRR